MDEELERIARRLQEREREAVEQLSLNESSARPVALDGSIGRVTRVDAIQQQQMALHGKRRLQLQLERIRSALNRLHEGTYGECAVCSEPIAPERLELIPEAPTCIECQRRLD